MFLKCFQHLKKSGKISLSLTHAHTLHGLFFFFKSQSNTGVVFSHLTRMEQNGWGMGSPLSLSFCNQLFHFLFLAFRGSQLWNPNWSPSVSCLAPSFLSPRREVSVLPLLCSCANLITSRPIVWTDVFYSNRETQKPVSLDAHFRS